MMKIAFAAALALGASSLSGCASLTTAPATTGFITDVQIAAKALCGVVPEALDIASLLPVIGSSAANASSVAQVICSSLVPATASARFKLRTGANAPASVTINGVVVHFI